MGPADVLYCRDPSASGHPAQQTDQKAMARLVSLTTARDGLSLLLLP